MTSGARLCIGMSCPWAPTFCITSSPLDRERGSNLSLTGDKIRRQREARYNTEIADGLQLSRTPQGTRIDRAHRPRRKAAR